MQASRIVWGLATVQTEWPFNEGRRLGRFELRRRRIKEMVGWVYTEPYRGT
jgi:hypothetical protein